MLADLRQAHNSLLELEIAPPVFDTVSCPSLDNHVDRVFLERTTEKRRPDVLLDHSKTRCSIQKRFKEAQELLVFISVNRTIVIEYGEKDGHD